MSVARDFERDTRWQSFRNVSGEEVPAFGLVELTGQEELEGGLIWQADKPDTTTESDQNAAVLAVNGPVRVPIGGYGECSQDWPMQVLFGEALTRKDRCGPKSGSWAVWGGNRTAFAYLGDDATDDDEERGWIVAAVGTVIKYGKVDDNPWTTGTATVSIWEWSGSAWADSTENETVSMPPWIATWSVATGTWVRLDYDYQSEKWIVTDPPIEVYGKVDSTWTSSTATVSIWANGSDTTANLTVYAPPLLASGSIASGKWVRIEWCFDSTRWEVVSAEC